MMETNTTSILALVAAGSIVGVIVSFWSKIKSFFQSISNYLVITVSLDWRSTHIVSSYLFAHCKRSKFSSFCYHCLELFVKPIRRKQYVPMEGLGNGTLLFWKGFRPLWISSGRSDSEGSADRKVVFIRWTFEADKLILDSFAYCNNLRANDNDRKRFYVKHVTKPKNFDGDDQKRRTSYESSDYNEDISFRQYRPLKWDYADLGTNAAIDDPVSVLCLSSDMQDAVEEARFWIRSEDWYTTRGIPWKRGWLLWGSPGTGKTSLARAIAQELDLPVYSYDLASMANDTMLNAWSEMMTAAPCMALIEDIDSVFAGRKNVLAAGKMKDSLTFDCLLNCIDGIEQCNGLFVVVTTNTIASLDPALGGSSGGETSSARPGRIDRLIKCGPLDKTGMFKMCKRILPGSPAEWEQVIASGLQAIDTPAQFQERCARAAFELGNERLKLKAKAQG
ncbi:MAG TPA: AAA family ATPase [Planctomycetota bacterium]|jgi:hypothetical protein